MINKLMLKVLLKYQIGQINSTGDFRYAEVVYGDPELCQNSIDTARALGVANPQISMVFRENKPFEKLGGYQMQNDLIDIIKDSYLPDVDMNYIPIVFARHYPEIDKKKEEDKDKEDSDNIAFELNLIVPQQLNGRRFNFYMHRRDIYLRRAVDRYLHKKYPEFTLPSQNPQYVSYRKGDGVNGAKDIVVAINKSLQKNKVSILTKDDFMECLEGTKTSKSNKSLSELGYEFKITRQSIKISKDGEKKAIYLKSEVLTQDFNFASFPSYKPKSETLDKPLDFYKEELDKQVTLRKERLAADYPELYKAQTIHLTTNTRKEVKIYETKQFRLPSSRDAKADVVQREGIGEHNIDKCSNQVIQREPRNSLERIQQHSRGRDDDQNTSGTLREMAREDGTRTREIEKESKCTFAKPERDTISSGYIAKEPRLSIQGNYASTREIRRVCEEVVRTTLNIEASLSRKGTKAKPQRDSSISYDIDR